MKLVLDACVLYPTVMREVLLGVAERGGFRPVWSDRILEEWARAARKIVPGGEAQARGEIALMHAAWPDACNPAAPGIEGRLWLPDPADRHVLAVAIAASADGIVTLNARDFPRGTLAGEGLRRVDPDGLLMELWQAGDGDVAAAAEAVRARASAISGQPWGMRVLLKKARLPRLGKALAAG